MSNTIPLINRKVVFEYHALGVIIILSYLVTALRMEAFWEILPVISTAGLCLVTAGVVFRFKRPEWIPTLSFIKNQTQQVIFDSSAYLFTALVVILMEAYLLDHPLIFIGKAVIAILSIGFYTAVGIALEVEYGHIKSYQGCEPKNITQITPAARKWRYLQVTLLTIVLLIFGLAWLGHSVHPDKHDFIELLFVSTTIISFSLYLIYLYNRNFIYVLGMQVNVLGRVEDGRFDIVVPTVSDDELALLATYHNGMIDRLRDRERLYRTLEKSVGANIMNKLLNTDEATLKQGQTYNVAILFCDLRGFTSLGESASAEEIILFLNVYFADISGVISEHNGIINKFMGDAVLAIFGLESDGNPVEDAVNASLAIVKHSTDFYMPNAMHPESGVGIDFGSVIGGTIGSEERYEYTIIGDAVNKASRLESLSKRLGYSIILSQNAYKWLSNDMRKNFDSLGEHKVRGGNEPITIYGSGKNQKDSRRN
ncbi:MAG: adenylate/guanylate cyclase domain-containing protein [Methylococcales bacterium]|nr:adenylate/guanylate cyclase domain-containing protein [Methylococcales bacterium]